MRLPADAIIAVTNRCNAHCLMCNVWRSTAPDLLDPVHMQKLPPQLRTINLTGGEPFLREDLGEFVAEARRRCPRAVITISTNAYLPDIIARKITEIRRIDPAIRLAVSLDGLGEAHDRMRGDEGAFDKAMDLINRLQADGFEGLRLSMTLTGENVDQLLGVCDLADKLSLQLGVVAAHDSLTHLGVSEPFSIPASEALDADFAQVITGWLRSWRPKMWLRAHFANYTYRYLTGRELSFKCGAGRDFFFVQADGIVYNCSVRGRRMGDLTSESWEQIWSSPPAAQARKASDRCAHGCWMICTARSVYRRRPVWAAAWIAKHKLLAHLRPRSRPASDRAAGG